MKQCSCLRILMGAAISRPIARYTAVFVLILHMVFSFSFFANCSPSAMAVDVESAKSNVVRSDKIERNLIKRWTSMLSSDDYSVRENAMLDLVKTRPINVLLLAELCTQSDEEVAWRAQAATLGVFPMLQHADGERLMLTIRDRAIAVSAEEPSLSLNLIRLNAKLENRRQLVAAQLQELGMEVNVLSSGAREVKFVKTIDPNEELFLKLASVVELATLNLEGQPVTDSDLELMQFLPDLEKLYLMGTRLKGDGIRHLEEIENLNGLSLRKLNLDGEAYEYIGRLKGLKYLGLDQTNVRDPDLAKLEQLKNLQQLWLNDTKTTDRGLVSLGKLESLEKLVLTRVPINGTGLKHLANLKRLAYLSLEGCNLDDTNAGILGQLQSLETLGLDKTAVSDKSISEIKSLKKLKVLWLSNSKITDACVPDLLQMNELERLILYDCRMSPENIRKLKVGLPQCVVEFE